MNKSSILNLYSVVKRATSFASKILSLYVISMETINPRIGFNTLRELVSFSWRNNLTFDMEKKRLKCFSFYLPLF